MGKASRSKKIAALEPGLRQVLSAFGKLSRKEQRQFANALFSDGGPTNPKLANPSKQSRGAYQVPATSQFGQPSPDEEDYFRQSRNRKADYSGEPDSSITPARITLSVRMRTNPIRGLNFERFVGYLDQWRLGFFRQAGMAWDTMERRDYQLQICRPKRMKSVARHGYDILIRDDIDEAQQTAAQAQKDFLANFYANASTTTAINPDEDGGFSLLMRQMMDAVGKYYAVHEIIWQPLPDGTLTAKFIFCPVWWFEGTRGKLRFLPSEFQIYGNEMLPGDWMVTCGDGIMEACSILYLMKSMLLKSNLAFLDKFGQPGIHGKTDAQKGTKEWDDFIEAIQEFGEEWATATNRGAEISLIETKGGAGAEGYGKLLEVFDKAITQLWRGADLGTTSSQHGTGASLQEDESEILETDDAKMIEETLDAKVTKFALAWKFGPDAPALAYIKLRTTPRRNIQDDIAVDTFLSGFKDEDGKTLLGVETTLERYSRPMPKPGEDTLQTSTPAAAPGKVGPDGKPIVPPAATDKNPEFTNAADAEALRAALKADLADLIKNLGIENDSEAAQAIFQAVLESMKVQFANDFNPDEPRDDHGKWTNGNGVSFEEHSKKKHVIIHNPVLVKETPKAMLIKHGDSEGWLMKSRMKESGSPGDLTITKAQAENFKSSNVTLNGVKVLKESDNALLIEHQGAEGWIPKSQIKTEGDNITMPRWVAGKLQATHSTISVDHAAETESGKAYKLSVDVGRPDGEPESATIFIPKSQVAEYTRGENGEHNFKIPNWLRAAKESEYEASHSGGGFTFHLLW